MQVIPISLGMVKTYLIKGEVNSILVDTGIPGSAGKILEALAKNSVDPRTISLIIITHNHTDHVGELKKLKELTGAKVAVHRNGAGSLKLGKSEAVNPTGLLGRILMNFFGEPKLDTIEPEILIGEELQLEPYGVGGRIIHTPGHTPGSVSILLSNGEAIIGDMVIGRSTSKGTKASYPMFATDLTELKKSLQKIVAYAPKTIYTSHGDTCTAEAVGRLISKLQ